MTVLKRIVAAVYTQGKFGKKWRETLDTDNPCLYSGGRYPTRITPEDLPEYYFPIHSRVIWYMNGYLKMTGIVDMGYSWVKENHLFKGMDIIFMRRILLEQSSWNKC